MGWFDRKGQARQTAGRKRRQRRQYFLGLLGPGSEGFESLEGRVVPTVSTWTGLGTDALWSDNANWDNPPAAGNDLVFPTGTANENNTDDLPAGTSFNSLTISGSGYVIGGNGIALVGTLDSSQSTGSNELDLPLSFTSTGTVTVDTSGAALTIGGAISGTEGLTKAGSGQLNLTGTNGYTGTTTVNAGVLDVDATQSGSPVTVNAGATLGGSGTVGTVTSNSGIVSPGTSSPALLTDSGDLDLGSGSTLSVTLDGTTAGSQYSQLAVAGQINLNGATLSGIANFTPSGNNQFTIISNTGTQPVTGTFAGLAQGGIVTISGQSYSISYTGGSDGRDVVLTNLLATTTTVTPSSSSIVSGQSISLTAVVSATTSTTNSPTGSVQFFDGATSLGTATLSGTTASLTGVTLPVGTDSITAKYLGDGNFSTSTSVASTVIVSQSTSTTTLSSSINPSVVGQSVTFTVTVAAVSPGAGTPSGTVNFMNGATSLGTVGLVGGVATLTTSSLPVGSNSITAVYSGDGNFVTSTASATTQTVSQAATTTTLTNSPATAGLGQSVTLTASVAVVSPGAGTPTGTVQFLNGSTVLGTGTLGANGTATITTTALPVGTDSIIAVYSGDTNFTTSSSTAITQIVNVGGTTVTLSGLNTGTPAYGDDVEFTVTVAPQESGTATPTGTVNFYANGSFVGSRPLDANGQAVFDINNLSIGTESLTAVYQGDSNFTLGGTSAPLTIVVGNLTQQFLNQLYIDVLGQPIDTPSLSNWTFELQAGGARKRLVHQLINSPQAKAHLGKHAVKELNTIGSNQLIIDVLTSQGVFDNPSDSTG